MDGVLVPAKTETGETYIVLKNSLNHLIQKRRIQKLRRSEGWLEIDEDQRKNDNPRYTGPERRASSMVDWTLFPLPIAEQLRRGQSLEAVLGYGQGAREIVQKLKNVAGTNLSVLIQGRTGTGKGMVASILHELSKRKDKPLSGWTAGRFLRR